MPKSHFTQWAAQFAVASELCKNGYEVAFTLGHNTPLADLMVISPNQKNFLIDVKGLYKRNSWLVTRKPEREGLFYVLAFVPLNAPNRYFILTQNDANELVEKYFREHPPIKNPDRVRVDSFGFQDPASFENRWDLLPS